MALNKTTKVLSVALAMFAIVGMMVVINNQQAFARPAPDAPVGPHVMKINLIGVPNNTDRNCDSGNSKNIYTPIGTDDGGKIRDNPGHQHIFWFLAASNTVTDHCTEGVGVAEDAAEVDIVAGEYVVSVRILGPANDLPKNFLKICSETVTDHNGNIHCVIDEVEIVDTVTRNSGKPVSTTLSKHLFNDAGENSVWSFVNGERFRLAQIDIWELP